MRWPGFFGKKKATKTTKTDEVGTKAQPTVKSYSNSAAKTNPVTPYAYDTALFDQFYNDLKQNALPEIPNPTQTEIMEYTRERDEMMKKKNSISDDVNVNFLMENMAIPVEVEIWVDKVYKHYFDKLMPMMGLVHWCEGARKALYTYRGYKWHTISELYPLVHFD